MGRPHYLVPVPRGTGSRRVRHVGLPFMAASRCDLHAPHGLPDRPHRRGHRACAAHARRRGGLARSAALRPAAFQPPVGHDLGRGVPVAVHAGGVGGARAHPGGPPRAEVGQCGGPCAGGVRGHVHRRASGRVPPLLAVEQRASAHPVPRVGVLERRGLGAARLGGIPRRGVQTAWACSRSSISVCRLPSCCF